MSQQVSASQTSDEGVSHPAPSGPEEGMPTDLVVLPYAPSIPIEEEGLLNNASGPLQQHKKRHLTRRTVKKAKKPKNQGSEFFEVQPPLTVDGRPTHTPQPEGNGEEQASEDETQVTPLPQTVYSQNEEEAAFQASTAKLTAELADIKASLQHQLQENQKEKEAHEACKSLNSRLLAELAANNEALKQQQHERENETSAYQAEIARLSGINAGISQELQAEKLSRDELQKNCSLLDTALATTQEAKNNLDKKIEALEADLAKADSAFTANQNIGIRCHILECWIKSLLKQFFQQRDASADIIKRLETNIEDQARRVKELEAEKANMQQSLSSSSSSSPSSQNQTQSDIQLPPSVDVGMDSVPCATISNPNIPEFVFPPPGWYQQIFQNIQQPTLQSAVQQLALHQPALQQPAPIQEQRQEQQQQQQIQQQQQQQIQQQQQLQQMQQQQQLQQQMEYQQQQEFHQQQQSQQQQEQQQNSVDNSTSQVLVDHSLTSNITLQIRQGDITEEYTDAIVNAANCDLQHYGGLARAIVNAGGDIIQQQSNEWIAKHGRVNTGDVAVTTSGRLPCSFIIHAVGPVWRGGILNEKDLLFRSIWNSLSAAMQNNLQSVSLPAISSGIFGYPKDKCAHIMLDAISQFANVNKNICKLKQIRIVCNDSQMLGAFKDEFIAKFQGGLPVAGGASN